MFLEFDGDSGVDYFLHRIAGEINFGIDAFICRMREQVLRIGKNPDTP
jgi:hypothetical protein